MHKHMLIAIAENAYLIVLNFNAKSSQKKPFDSQ